MDENVKVTPVSPGGGYPPQGYGPPSGYGAGGYGPPRRSGGCLGAWAVLATLGLGLSLFLNMVLAGAKAGGGADGSSGPTMLHEKVLEGDGDDKVAVIEIEGVIMDKQSGGLFGGAGGEGLVKRVHDQLDKAKNDASVKAVVLAVDSPGGGVTASDQIHHELMKFRESKKPLVIHQGALAASGGYYVSAPGDEIIADQTTITGSIGVILGGGINAYKFLKDHGFEEMTVKSGPNKDLLSMTGPPREEHQKILQATVDDMYERFCWVVAEGMARRKAGNKTTVADQKAIDEVMPEVKKLADGRIYTSKQALELGLVTSIGYREDAYAAAKKRAGISAAKIVLYKKQPTLMDVLSGNVESRFGGGVNVKIDPSALDELSTPRFLVLWRADK